MGAFGDCTTVYWKEFPKIIRIHVFSDGPKCSTTKIFYLFIQTKELGFLYSTWNFSEPSYGKGAADGVEMVSNKSEMDRTS